jgi:hypothetical protein
MISIFKRTGEKLSKHRWKAYELSAKILSWGILLQEKSKSDEFTELEGLGLSLEDYSRQLRKISRSIDEIELELAAAERNESQEGVLK